MSIDPTLPDDLKRDISLAAEILLREGCKEVYVFGSVARGTYTPESDIDIATIGLPKSKFFSAYGLLLSRLHRQVDLVGLDYDQDFGRSLRAEGSLTRVA
jgi:predicted nucleotidyltransferase